MSIRDTFRTRFNKAMEDKWGERGSIKKLCEASGIDKEGNYRINEAQVKSYRKENGRIPRIDTLEIIANTLDVDMGYLIDEKQTHKHSASQTICEATGLSEPAADTLRSLLPHQLKALDDMLIHPEFKEFLNQSAKMVYGHAQTSFHPFLMMFMKRISSLEL